jgi:hypothetical protein
MQRFTFILLTIAFLTNQAYAQQPYLLPEILKTNSGNHVTTVAIWQKIRRPEILSLFEQNVYGMMPKTFDAIKYTITNDVPDAMDGKAHLQEVTITVSKSDKAVAIHLVLFVPNNRVSPAPAFLLINNRGKTNIDPTRETKSDFWPVEMAIDSGYAMAAFVVNDAAPDDKNTYQNGVLQLYPEQLSIPDGMKAIGAWAWAASRVMDYLQTNPLIDAKKVNIVGHSRGGKAALWAGAEDQRFAMVFSNCSGNTGAALSHRKSGETIKVINTNFPHWFADNYKKYNDNEAALPLDQHMLLALIAPRPLYTTNATKDLWADPAGSYLSVLEAKKVYALYGKSSALTPEPPPPNTPIIKSTIGYHIREGEHNLTAYDWSNFIRFANYNFYHQ